MRNRCFAGVRDINVGNAVPLTGRLVNSRRPNLAKAEAVRPCVPPASRRAFDQPGIDQDGLTRFSSDILASEVVVGNCGSFHPA